ncbi:MAG: hypothetical protein GX975_06960 [Clostridiales bacterium]|nr:hypothetical protein [Clostridiales bacterium]
MKKVIVYILIAAIALACLAGCNKDQGKDKEVQEDQSAAILYEELSKLAMKLVDKYNEIAAKAKENGWEADFDTLKAMHDIADAIDKISEAVTNPEGISEEALQKYKDSAKELLERLETEIESKINELYQSEPQSPAE